MAKPIPSIMTLAVVVTTWCLAVDPRPVRGAVVSEKWSVEYMLSAPDCLERVVMGINGMYPGPTLRAKAGDTINVEMINKLPTEGLVIHWHGIRMIGTPWADGTASISQCPVLPGESFNYTFKVDKPGTYFYHGHYGMQRASGLYGSLIVDAAEGHPDPFKYDDEFTLLFADWYHRSTHEQEVDLSTKPFRWIGEPQSLLMNGKGQFNCSLASKYNSSWGPPCKLNGTEHCAPQILHVSPNKVYRIRLASSTSLASLNFAVQGHKLQVVEADGNYVQPFEVDDLDVYSGDTYSVLLKADQPPNANYWVRIAVRGRKPLTPPGLTILNYQPTSEKTLPAGPPPETPLWNNHTHSKAFVNKILAADGLPPPPPGNATKRLVFLNTQNKIDGHFKWAINNVSLSLPPTPYLGSLLFKLKEAFDQTPPPENYPPEYDITVPPANENTVVGNGVYNFELNSTVDVVLQNANALNANTSEIHPWHLHGHDFWLLGYGDGKFTEEDAKKFNVKNPPLRNSAVVFPYGWTALRYVADNPGAWAFHCHIEPHLHMGMGVVVAEGVDQVKGIPSDALACGLTRDLLDGKKEFVP